MTQTIAQCALQGASELLSRYQRESAIFPSPAWSMPF
jgi:hypothetical protein